MLSRVLVLLLLAAAATALQQRINGHYRTVSCSCDQDRAEIGQSCQLMFADEYESTSPSSLQFDMTPEPAGTFATLTGTVSTRGHHSFSVARLNCEGLLSKGFSCKRGDEEVCVVMFACEDGPCATSYAIQGLNSVMFPVLACLFVGLMAALAFIWATAAPLAKTLTIGIAGAQFLFSLFLLFTPAVYSGLILILAASMATTAAAWGKRPLWLINLVASLLVFLFLGGMTRYLQTSSSPQEFYGGAVSRVVTLSFLDESCETFYGTPADEQRCQRFLVFVVCCVAVVYFLQPLMMVLSLYQAGESDKGKGKTDEVEMKKR